MLWGKIAKIQNGKVGKFVIKNVKNGNLLKVMVGLSVVSEISTGIIEVRNEKDNTRKLKRFLETFARSAGSLTYLAPYVGCAM